MARRRANRHAAPFSRGLPKAHPDRPGRKPGVAYRRKAHRRPPPQCGLSFGCIGHLFRDRFGLTFSRGGLVHAVHRAARQAQPTYEALCAQVRGSPVVTPDETAHQTCLARLLRRCRTMMLDYPHHPFAPQVDHLLRAALATRDRYSAGTVSDHGLAVARGAYAHRLDRLLDHRPAVSRTPAASPRISTPNSTRGSDPTGPRVRPL